MYRLTYEVHLGSAVAKIKRELRGREVRNAVAS